jgi:hypothetical protein
MALSVVYCCVGGRKVKERFALPFFSKHITSRMGTAPGRATKPALSVAPLSRPPDPAPAWLRQNLAPPNSAPPKRTAWSRAEGRAMTGCKAYQDGTTPIEAPYNPRGGHRRRRTAHGAIMRHVRQIVWSGHGPGLRVWHGFSLPRRTGAKSLVTPRVRQRPDRTQGRRPGT